MSDEQSKSSKIIDFLGNTGSPGYKRIIDLSELALFVGVDSNKLFFLCKNLKESKRIYFEKVSKDKAIMRLQPKFRNVGSESILPS
jgi:hypothetical protein